MHAYQLIAAGRHSNRDQGWPATLKKMKKKR
jgi:hypothetical protein